MLHLFRREQLRCKGVVGHMDLWTRGVYSKGSLRSQEGREYSWELRVKTLSLGSSRHQIPPSGEQCYPFCFVYEEGNFSPPHPRLPPKLQVTACRKRPNNWPFCRQWFLRKFSLKQLISQFSSFWNAMSLSPLLYMPLLCIALSSILRVRLDIRNDSNLCFFLACYSAIFLSCINWISTKIFLSSSLLVLF